MYIFGPRENKAETIYFYTCNKITGTSFFSFRRKHAGSLHAAKHQLLNINKKILN